VAPPHISRLPAPAMICAVAGAALSMSCVRMRVASSDWCASRLCCGERRTGQHTEVEQMYEQQVDIGCRRELQRCPSSHSIRPRANHAVARLKVSGNSKFSKLALLFQKWEPHSVSFRNQQISAPGHASVLRT
jgi:hypothetical protein